MLPDLSPIAWSTTGPLVTLCVALAGLLACSIARRHNPSSPLMLWYSIGFSSLALLTTDSARLSCAGAGVVCAVLHSWWRRRVPHPCPEVSSRASSALSLLGVIAVSYVLLFRLGAEHVPPLVWEATVILDFFDEMQSFDLRNAFLSRLLWAQGLLSEGDRALLYGLPTIYLLSWKSSLVSLRIFSAIYFLGATISLAHICKRFVTPAVATATLFTFGLNELGLIFGRYGSSIAGTLCSVILSFLACASLVRHPSVGRGVLAVLCLYLATLGYAPGRIVVLILIGMTLLGILCNRSESRTCRVCVSLVFCAGVLVVCAVQRHFAHFHVYAYARGEEISMMLETGYWPDPLLKKWAIFKAENRPPNAFDYISFGRELISSVTLPQLRNLISPFDQSVGEARGFSSDPLGLELFAKPLYPFILVGLCVASSYTSRWMALTLVAWLVGGGVPVLLTNRVDSYRTSMLLVPLAVWMAIGIVEAMNQARRARVPRALITSVPLVTALVIMVSRAGSLHFPTVPPTSTEVVISQLPPRLLHDATIGVEFMGFRTLAYTKVLLLQREQKGLTNPGLVVPENAYQHLLSTASLHERMAVVESLVQDLSNDKPVILGPYVSMLSTLQELSRLGFRVTPIDLPNLRVAYVRKEGGR